MNFDYNIIIYIIFGILPSLAWLFYYLNKDLNPEPKRVIISLFIWGAIITLPVFLIQVGLATLLKNLELDPIITSIFYWFIVISFTEEIFKYLVVRFNMISSYHLDEPVDVMIYMIVVALGFAALENILYLFFPAGQMTFDQIIGRTVFITFMRFIGATFLHTLCSAIIGYSMAVSFFNIEKGKFTVAIGILMAVLLHGIFNFSIMQLDGNLKLIIPVAIILILAYIIFSAFGKLKTKKGVCKIPETNLN